MQLWVVFFVGAALLGAIAWFGVLRIDIDAQGLGRPNGTWAIAFGLDTGFLAIAGALASEEAPRFELRTLGRRFSFQRSTRRPEGTGKPFKRFISGIWGRARALSHSMSLPEAVNIVVSERRRIAVDALDIDITYGFRDIVLTGKLAGALYALSGAVPRRIRLTHRPRWDGGERFEFAVHGTLSLWLGRVLTEFAWFMLRRRWGSVPASGPMVTNDIAAEVSR